VETLVEPSVGRADGPAWLLDAMEPKPMMTRGRVLVVDDDDFITDAMRLALEPAAYTVGAAASATGALAEAEVLVGCAADATGAASAAATMARTAATYRPMRFAG
jgi:hypothetical protein